MNRERVRFQGSHGVALAAQLDRPAGAAKAYALFAHCFTCTRNLKAVGHISRALTDREIAVFRFDFTGLGESEGDFSHTNFSSNVEDLLAAAAHMEREWDPPAILIGHSLGGAAVLRAASSLEKVRAVATIGAPYDPRHIEHLLRSAHEEIERSGVAEVSIGGRSFTIRKQFLDDLDSLSKEDGIGSLRKALMVMHSPVDNVVGIDNAAMIFQAAKHSKSFVSLDDADHLLSDSRDSLYAGAVVATWAGRYL
jgi:pimeloyl-ACP methyl ester carboxylesterase